jgi:exosortase
MTDERALDRRLAPSVTRSGALVLIVITVASFFPTAVTFVKAKGGVFSTYDYVVLLSVLWYAWNERATLVARDRVWWQPVGLMAPLSLLWLAGTVAHVEVITQTAAPVLLVLWTAALCGRRAAVRLLPILAIVLIAVPFLGAVRSVLQALTVVVSGKGAALFGVPAVIEEQVIQTTYGSFLVADYCAGTGYLLVGLVVGAIYAQQGIRTGVGTWLTIALAGLFPIIGNWIRVAGLILIGHASRMESVFITSPIPHALFGWGIFVAALGLFFVSARRIERFDSRRATPHGSGEQDSVPVGSLVGLPAQLLATAAAVLGPALYFMVGSLPTRTTADLDVANRDLAWVEAGETTRPYAWAPLFEGAERHKVAIWNGPPGAVLVDQLIYREQSPGREVLGGGNRIAPSQAIMHQRMAGPVGADRHLVNEAIVRSGEEGHLLVWYWYRVGGFDTALRARAMVLELWGFVTRRTDVELVAVSSPCAIDSCSQAARTLAAFFDDDR